MEKETDFVTLRSICVKAICYNVSSGNKVKINANSGMKKDDIEKIISKNFKPLHKSIPKILKDFDEDEIHDFRVSIKKLRAFLQLLSFQVVEEEPLHITKKMKTFYGYVGIIRNMQLQLKAVNQYCKTKKILIPKNYFTELEKEIEYWKSQALALMADDNNFLDDEETIMKLLPNKLTNASIKLYVASTMNEINELAVHIEKEDAIHSIRKLLKTLLYNWEYAQAFAYLLPGKLSTEKNIKLLADKLGDFRDICIAINHLKTMERDKINDPDEIRLLTQMEANWNKVKEKQVQKVRSAILSLVTFTHPQT